jgi:hypothetical protein
MAYIVGVLSPEEEAELERRGWEVELAPEVDFDTGKISRPFQRLRMVWVDQDMFKIMDGPDWDKGNDSNHKAEGETGDFHYERWWNTLGREQRAVMLAKLRLQTPDQLEVFSDRLWHELHSWMRDELRRLCRDSTQMETQ